MVVRAGVQLPLHRRTTPTLMVSSAPPPRSNALHHHHDHDHLSCFVDCGGAWAAAHLPLDASGSLPSTRSLNQCAPSIHFSLTVQSSTSPGLDRIGIKCGGVACLPACLPDSCIFVSLGVVVVVVVQVGLCVNVCLVVSHTRLS